MGIPKIPKWDKVREMMKTMYTSIKGDATLASDGTLTIADRAVTGQKIGLGEIRAENIRCSSPESIYTATGEVQTIAHALGRNPTFAFVIPVNVPGVYEATITWDTELIYITVTSGVRYQIFAM